MENNESKIKMISLILTILIISVFVIKTPWIKIINRDFFPVLNSRDIRIFYYTDIEDLAIAVDKQDSVSICKILNIHPEYLNETDDVYGTTVLSYAVEKNKRRSIKILLKYGADPTQNSNINPIMVSIINNNEKIFFELIRSSNMLHKDNLIYALCRCMKEEKWNKYYEPLVNLDIIRYDEEGALLGYAIKFNRYDFAVDLLRRDALFVNEIEFNDKSYTSKHLLTDYIEDKFPFDTLQYRYKLQFISMLEERGLYKKKEED
ncbi:MAG: ankyrin repeat domain-containing protein [Paludibacteraceae bacterium]|nr:ankyrin repeat domain-containing protein [Paludibacteraceae bacterium]